MSKRKETKQVQRGKVVKQSCRLGSRTESEQGEDSTLRDTVRDRWSEEAVFNEPLAVESLREMSRKNNRERVEEREEVDEGVLQPQATAVKSGEGNDMMVWMQMWMEESKRKDEAWRVEMRMQWEDVQGREDRLMAKMQAQIEATTTPVTVKTRTESLNLPRLTANSSLDTFISTFETQLNMATIPESDWKLKLVGQLDECHRVQISYLIADLDSSYTDIIQGLKKANGETSSSASQRYFAAEPDLSKFDNTTKALRVVSQWEEKITKGLETKKEVLVAMNRARVRSWDNSSLNTFVNQRDISTNNLLISRVAEWKAENNNGVSEFPKPGQRESAPGAGGTFPKKPGSCFLCGKVGHFARECRNSSRGANSSMSNTPSDDIPKIKTEGKVIKCYRCGEIGHKKPECPNKKKASVVKVGPSRVLRRNEMLATVGGISMPVTLDTGAEVSVLPTVSGATRETRLP